MDKKEINPIAPFEVFINQDGKNEVITIRPENHVFEIIYQGRVIGVLKPPGEDWQLLPLDEISNKIPLFEIDLEAPLEGAIQLHAPLINQIAGEIENHLK